MDLKSSRYGIESVYVCSRIAHMLSYTHILSMLGGRAGWICVCVCVCLSALYQPIHTHTGDCTHTISQVCVCVCVCECMEMIDSFQCPVAVVMACVEVVGSRSARWLHRRPSTLICMKRFISAGRLWHNSTLT